MKINIFQTIDDFKGNPVVNEKGKALTLRDVIVLSINNIPQGTKLDESQKLDLFNIGLKMYGSKDPKEGDPVEPINFTSEEIVLIKERVSDIYGPLVYGRVYQILENPPKDK